MDREAMMKAAKFINETMKFWGRLDEAIFRALISMMLEEYCRVNDLDVVEFSNMINEKIKEVNDKLGKYE